MQWSHPGNTSPCQPKIFISWECRVSGSYLAYTGHLSILHFSEGLLRFWQNFLLLSMCSGSGNMRQGSGRFSLEKTTLFNFGSTETIPWSEVRERNLAELLTGVSSEGLVTQSFWSRKVYSFGMYITNDQGKNTEYLFTSFAVFLEETSGHLCEWEHGISWTAVQKAFNNSHYFMREKKNLGAMWIYLAQDLKCISTLYIFPCFVPPGLFGLECFTHVQREEKLEIKQIALKDHHWGKCKSCVRGSEELSESEIWLWVCLSDVGGETLAWDGGHELWRLYSSLYDTSTPGS